MDIDENCVLHINCDSPGCRWATVFEDVFWMSEAEGIARAVIRDVTGQDSSGGRPLRAGDKSFSNIGVSTFYMLSSTMPKDVVKEKNYYPTGGGGGKNRPPTQEETPGNPAPGHPLPGTKEFAAAGFGGGSSP